jgi:predicted MFS family arabinose efflux permease
MTAPRQYARARWATRAQFLHLGLIAGLFGAHVPSLAARYAFDEQRIAVTLLAATAGSVVMLLLAGRIIARLGARAVSVLAGTVFAVSLSVLLVLPSPWLVFPLMFCYGAGQSLYDIAINAEGSMLELLGGKAVMSGFHAMFSVGAMLGAGAASIFFRNGVAPSIQLASVGIVVAGLMTIAARGMLPMHPPADAGTAHFAWPRGLLLLIGLLIMSGMLAEGVMYNWSVLYVQQELGALPQRAALAYVAFSGATAAMRFAGDWVRARVAERTVVIAGAALSAVAMTGTLLAHDTTTAMLGFAFVGIGLATVVPILYNAATRVPGVSRAAGIASASSIGYVGFMIGPPIVGAIAHAANLSWALCTLIVACAILVFGATRIPLGQRRTVPAGVLA